jgi:hypothetical protein
MVSFYKDRRVRVWHRDSSQSVELDAVDAWELYEALGYYAGDLRKLAQAAYWSRKSADPFVFLPSPQGLVPVLFWTDGLKNAVIQAMKGYKDDGGSDQTIDLPEG